MIRVFSWGDYDVEATVEELGFEGDGSLPDGSHDAGYAISDIKVFSGDKDVTTEFGDEELSDIEIYCANFII